MTTLIFLLTFFSLLILLIVLIVKAIKHKHFKKELKAIIIITSVYALLWSFSYFKRKDIPVKPNTDVCFDDWCATITKIEQSITLQKQLNFNITDSSLVILHVKMSNHARGVAQKPSEPRIYLVDEKGKYWSYSINGQHALEKILGKQIGIDTRLELGQSLETQLVYTVPSCSKKLNALIEEGPFITQLLFPENRLIFPVK